jgi:hypothetical protein
LNTNDLTDVWAPIARQFQPWFRFDVNCRFQKTIGIYDEIGGGGMLIALRGSRRRRESPGVRAKNELREAGFGDQIMDAALSDNRNGVASEKRQ